jgi:serine/threonine protein kinase
MASSVESMCNLLARSRLLAPDSIRALYQLWRSTARDPANVTHFSRWLVDNRYVTEYQIGLLLLGRSGSFFLNEYKLLERIGKGRMAGVYKAVHALGQVVAVKVLPPSRAKDAEAFCRFQREARLSLKLKHPNVVRTYEVGEADGVHYLVMEYLEGETLEELLQRRGRLPAGEAAALVYEGLLGLQHIHEQGMIHRDLKPGNLMLACRSAKPRGNGAAGPCVKVLDIGLGRALFDEAPAPAELGELTTQGAVLGTPDYTAPEQARDAHRADIRADVYSMGCVLYHLLAGRPPFADVSVVRQIVRHATEVPRPLRHYSAEVPDALQEIVNGMLAKDPAQRYPIPNQAARALRVFLQSESLSPQPAASDPAMPSYAQWLEGRHQDPARLGRQPQEPPPEVVIPVPNKAVTMAQATECTDHNGRPPRQGPVYETGLPELAGLAAPAEAVPKRHGRSLGFWVAVGIGFVLTAAVLGWLLAEILRRGAAP